MAGAALIAVGLTGALAWVWVVARTSFGDDAADSLGERLDALADQTLLLMFAAAVVGVGIGLRVLSAGDEPDRPSLVGRPVGRILLAVTGTLLAVVVAATVLDDQTSTFAVELVTTDEPIDRSEPPIIVVPPATTVAAPPPTYTLEVHSDGCGVFRSGAIGDDLTWSVRDQDGFQVLGRNAAGETQYRYFRPGTYTVVLETWGGGYYVDVSNEVTITC